MKFEAKNKWVFLTKIGERVCVVFAADAAMTSCHNTYFALKTLASFFLDYFLKVTISKIVQASFSQYYSWKRRPFLRPKNSRTNLEVNAPTMPPITNKELVQVHKFVLVLSMPFT